MFNQEKGQTQIQSLQSFSNAGPSLNQSGCDLSSEAKVSLVAEIAGDGGESLYPAFRCTQGWGFHSLRTAWVQLPCHLGRSLTLKIKPPH